MWFLWPSWVLTTLAPPRNRRLWTHATYDRGAPCVFSEAPSSLGELHTIKYSNSKSKTDFG